jgi:uncharacterized SAM-binding protein YcdF (DUF218 family)
MESTISFDAIVVLSAGTVPRGDGSGKYRSTTFEEADAFGVLGGYERVRATALLAQQYPAAVVVTTSKRISGKKPTHAYVVALELEYLGVSTDRIILEENSINIMTQISEVVALAKSRGWKKIALVTDEHFIPRASAMCDGVSPEGIEVEFVSAGKVLGVVDRELLQRYEELKRTESFKKRLEAETRGIVALERGKYKPAEAVDKKERNA